MPNFKKYHYNQDSMIVINFEEQIQQNRFAYTIHKMIDNHIKLDVFYKKHSNDSAGHTAYDPAILLKIILFSYSKGITFKALSCDSLPLFTGLANFVSSTPNAIESVF